MNELSYKYVNPGCHWGDQYAPEPYVNVDTWEIIADPGKVVVRIGVKIVQAYLPLSLPWGRRYPCTAEWKDSPGLGEKHFNLQSDEAGYVDTNINIVPPRAYRLLKEKRACSRHLAKFISRLKIVQILHTHIVQSRGQLLP
jgi:hypothetical protein